MSFATFEASQEGSRPLELYTISLGGENFRYVTSERAVTVGSNLYSPEVLVRDAVEHSAESHQQVIQVEVPGTNEFARRYISNIPGQRALFTITRVQIPDFPSPELFTIFQGFVLGVLFSNDCATAKISVGSPAVVATRAIPRHTYRAACNNFLFDNKCGVDPNDPDFKISGAIVTAAAGSTITVPLAAAYPNGFFDAGYVSALGGADARMVLSHVGSVLTLLLPFPFDLVGQPVDVRSGCRHNPTDCADKYSNIPNYGGWPFVPTRNPFQSGVV